MNEILISLGVVLSWIAVFCFGYVTGYENGKESKLSYAVTKGISDGLNGGDSDE